MDMLVGRIVRQGDFLFGDAQNPSSVSAGGVVLARQPGDDYVRFRVPDTTCPPLPEPSTPLDSGVSDEAEPNRWSVTGSPNTSNGWTMLQSRDIILLAYSCYDSDFLLEYTASVPGWTGTQNGAYFDGVGLEFQRDANNYVNAGIGLTPGGRGWGVRAVIAGVESKSIGPAVLSDVTFKAQVQRSGSNCSVRFWRSDTSEWTNWTTIGAVGSGLVTIRLVGLRFNMVPYGSSSRDVTVRVTNITTLSGAPSSVTVTTPVMDMGKSMKCTVQRVPAIGTLEWRASDTPFTENGSSPPWNNPVGDYRYWQARVTWTDYTKLLERVEFIVSAHKHILTIPCIGRNMEIWHAEGDFPRAGVKGVVSLERTPSGDSWVLAAQRLLTIDR
jgi:hypothetical protein